MLISRETDYSIRILRYLADGKLHTVSDMCSSECIPIQFGYKIVEKLQIADMVSCVKGKGGGCRLRADLKRISLYDVMAAVEHECCVNLCLSEGHVCSWQESHDDSCKVHPKLARIQEEMNERFRGLSMHSVLFD